MCDFVIAAAVWLPSSTVVITHRAIHHLDSVIHVHTYDRLYSFIFILSLSFALFLLFLLRFSLLYWLIFYASACACLYRASGMWAMCVACAQIHRYDRHLTWKRVRWYLLPNCSCFIYLWATLTALTSLKIRSITTLRDNKKKRIEK